MNLKPRRVIMKIIKLCLQLYPKRVVENTAPLSQLRLLSALHSFSAAAQHRPQGPTSCLRIPDFQEPTLCSLPFRLWAQATLAELHPSLSPTQRMVQLSTSFLTLCSATSVASSHPSPQGMPLYHTVNEQPVRTPPASTG